MVCDRDAGKTWVLLSPFPVGRVGLDGWPQADLSWSVVPVVSLGADRWCKWFPSSGELNLHLWRKARQ